MAAHSKLTVEHWVIRINLIGGGLITLVSLGEPHLHWADGRPIGVEIIHIDDDTVTDKISYLDWSTVGSVVCRRHEAACPKSVEPPGNFDFDGIASTRPWT